MTIHRHRGWHGVAGGLLLGYFADLLIGDPRRWHPVSGFGRAADLLERRTYQPTRQRGVLNESILVGSVVALGTLVQGWVRGSRWEMPTVAAATWVVLGGRSLEREALAVHAHLVAEDLPAARQQIRNLVGRDTETLTAEEIARACVESLAENCSDAVVAPLLWGAIGGTAGLLGYRAVNTLDAMVGHRTPRYTAYGWAAARLDDVANWVPARLATALTSLTAPLVGGSPHRVITIVRRDASQHPSPNAGQVESAFAAALGVRLGGLNTYDAVPEDRGVLGDGRDVAVADILRAIRLARAVSLSSLIAVISARQAAIAAMPRHR